MFKCICIRLRCLECFEFQTGLSKKLKLESECADAFEIFKILFRRINKQMIRFNSGIIFIFEQNFTLL